MARDQCSSLPVSGSSTQRSARPTRMAESHQEPLRRRNQDRHSRNARVARFASVALLGLALPTATAQNNCISLQGSRTCPAFNQSFISTNSSLLGNYPFLQNVTDLTTFDSALQSYVQTGYVQEKYVNLLGCSSVNLSNTSDLYARYTYSVICNGLIQNSITPCNVSRDTAPPLCADTCAEFALSEQGISSSPQLCGTAGPDAENLLRADLTTCSLPANAISGSCIEGYQNEPDNCGFQYNLEGLCSFCNASSINATDSCCVTSQAQTRCTNVRLPTFVSMQPLFSTSSPASPTGSATSSAVSQSGLSGGQIAGIVIGAVIGAGLILGLLVCGCVLLRKKRQERYERTSLNQPSPPLPREKGSASRDGQFSPAPGARVTRMSALEPSSDSEPGNNSSSPPNMDTSPDSHAGTRGQLTIGARKDPKSSSEGGYDGTSGDGAGYTSSDSAPNGQSEQLSAFKDYYSTDDIHQGELVSVLWAYSPRAADEFELERGEMIRIVGIWDDGWATGRRVDQRAESWDPDRNQARDSGFSGHSDPASPPTSGTVKAFPLVCVCLPQHWKKTLESDGTVDTTSSDT